MNFSDKLNFLMKITQTSNKDLASAISVDRSLISLLRTGKRGKPRNTDHIQHMALYFAKHCNANFQRHAISDMLGQAILRNPMPTEVLATYLKKWLINDSDILQEFMEEMETTHTQVPEGSLLSENAPVSNQETTYYYGNEGRRNAVRHMMKIVSEITEANSILVDSDDNLDWALEDNKFVKENENSWIKLSNTGYTIYQIMPSMNHISQYIESLQLWLSVYATGQAKVYYYPRFRDNLYRRSLCICPGHCVEASIGIGSENKSQITLVSTNPEIVQAFTDQFKECLALCRPAIITHTDISEIFPAFDRLAASKTPIIQKAASLTAITMPKDLLDYVTAETEDDTWNNTLQKYTEDVTHFEKRLDTIPHIDICHLASAREIREGTVPMFPSYLPGNILPIYTPETYIMHLKNILRLMDKYENYHFLPITNRHTENYSLFVSENNIVLLVRKSAPFLMLEIHRMEMVAACWEYLSRMAEQADYNDTRRKQIRLQIQSLIQELEA